MCHSTKGHGALSDFLNKHKVVVAENLMDQEVALQSELRARRVEEFAHTMRVWASTPRAPRSASHAGRTRARDASRTFPIGRRSSGRWSRGRVPPRDKRIRYNPDLLPKIDPKKEYSAADIVTGAMKVFARDSRVVSIDADLGNHQRSRSRRRRRGSTPRAQRRRCGSQYDGAGRGVCRARLQYLDQHLLPLLGLEGLRRIAVGYQERLESIESPDGWLSEGHGLDLTMLATASNFETRTNGATHMANDDALVFDAIAHLKIIDVSCPRQLLSIMQWIMEGNRGLVYLRVMRTPSAVLYGSDYAFQFGAGPILREGDRAVIVSSGRGVHEASGGGGISVPASPWSTCLLSMKNCCCSLYDSGRLMVFAEQNNGYIWQNFLKVLYRRRAQRQRHGQGGDRQHALAGRPARSSSTPRLTRS